MYGRDDAIAAFRAREMTVTTIITGNFDLSTPASWDADPGHHQRHARPRSRDRRVRVLHPRPARWPLVRRAHRIARRRGGALRRLCRVPSACGSRSSRHCAPTVVRAHAPRRRRSRRIAPASTVDRRPRQLLDGARLRGDGPALPATASLRCSSPTPCGARCSSRRPAAARFPATATSISRGSSGPPSTPGTPARSSSSRSGPRSKPKVMTPRCGAPSTAANALLEEVLS